MRNPPPPQLRLPQELRELDLSWISSPTPAKPWLPLVGDVRGSHFMLCVECVADKESKELLPESAGVGGRIADHCERRGVMVRPIGHLNVLSPPLILSREEIDVIVAVLRASIQATADDLVREGLWRG